MFLTPRSNVSAIQNSPSRISCSTSNLLSITKDSRAHSAGKEIPLMENQVVSESLLVSETMNALSVGQSHSHLY